MLKYKGKDVIPPPNDDNYLPVTVFTPAGTKEMGVTDIEIVSGTKYCKLDGSVYFYKGWPKKYVLDGIIFETTLLNGIKDAKSGQYIFETSTLWPSNQVITKNTISTPWSKKDGGGIYDREDARPYGGKQDLTYGILLSRYDCLQFEILPNDGKVIATASSAGYDTDKYDSPLAWLNDFYIEAANPNYDESNPESGEKMLYNAEANPIAYRIFTSWKPL